MSVDNLYQEIKQHVTDSAVSAWVAEEAMEPLSGPGSSVAPPSYPGARQGEKGYAASDEGFIPTKRESAVWYNDLLRDEDRRPVTARTVILDSTASRSNRAENALWDHRESLGGLPAFIVSAESTEGVDLSKIPETHRNEAKQFLAKLSLSSWQASHRQADAWFKYATAEGISKTILESPSTERDLLTSMNTTTDATSLYSYAPNAALYGFWFSSGSVERHRQPRAYSSETIGYGAHPVQTAAGRMDRLPASKDVAITQGKDGLDAAAKSKVSDGEKPSAYGFGMVPGTLDDNRFVCELILTRSSISLTTLRNIRFADDPERAKSKAAAVVLTVLGIAGHVLAQRDNTLLRSGCDLMLVEGNYGWRRTGKRDVEEFEMPNDIEALAETLRLAKAAAAAVGLEFAEPVELQISRMQFKLLAASIADEATKSGEDS